MNPHDPWQALLAESRAAGYRAAELRARVAAMPPAPDPADMPAVRALFARGMHAGTIGASRVAAAADGGNVIEEAGRRYEFASGGRVSVSEAET